MDLIDFILNLAGLLLWLNWRPVSPQAIAPPAVSLLSTLKRPEARAPKRWTYLVALLVLLVARPLLYCYLGTRADWIAQIHLVAISLPCRSIFLGRMYVFSCYSFALTLFIFYSSLILLALVNRKLPGNDPLQRLVRLHLGWVAAFPWPLKLLVPVLTAALAWVPSAYFFARLGMMPSPQGAAHVWQQSLIVGVAMFLAWKYLIAGVLLLHLLNSYVYLGNHPFWSYVNATAGNLLWPLAWLPLRFGKFDLLPVAALGLILLGDHFGAIGLADLYKRLPW